MKQIFIFCFFLLIMVTCNSGTSKNAEAKVETDKKYLLIEVSITNYLGEYRTKIDTTEIIEKNDSLAYLKAFEKSCISQQADRITAKELKKLGAKTDYETQCGFKLIDDGAKEIKDVVPDSVLNDIEKRISSITTD